MPKSKAVMTGPSDVEMNANSSSGAKKATNRTVSSVITCSRTSNMKKKAVTAVNNNEGSYANCNTEPNVISNVEIEDHTSGGFKQASSMISLTSELANDFDGLEASSFIDEPPELATATDEPPGSATTTETSPRTRNVLGDVELQNYENIQSSEGSQKEFIERFLGGNTFNNCVFNF
ncbi:25704_t:CDS:2 [Racocetra persica]|uniref:25704_t:CDS:1 n=1 Tax=Racocetra persica TaxID=160502 RepID=A0ACA9MRT4_9GLOM|nr:25704_t:CDS:2 [Racocetra persica]